MIKLLPLCMVGLYTSTGKPMPDQQANMYFSDASAAELSFRIKVSIVMVRRKVHVAKL